MPWPQMCHFPARGEKSKETMFLELRCKENNNSEKDWSHIFRLDTVVREMSEGKTFLFIVFLKSLSYSFHWVLCGLRSTVSAGLQQALDPAAGSCTQTTVFKV